MNAAPIVEYAGTGAASSPLDRRRTGLRKATAAAAAADAVVGAVDRHFDTAAGQASDHEIALHAARDRVAELMQALYGDKKGQAKLRKSRTARATAITDSMRAHHPGFDHCDTGYSLQRPGPHGPGLMNAAAT